MKSKQPTELIGGEPAATQPLKTVVLTNTRQSLRFESYVPDGAPDPILEYTYLRQNGVEQQLRDLNKFLLNPMAPLHPFYAGIDIARALRVLTLDRTIHGVLCVFENTALVLLMLRRIFRYKVPIFLLEVSGRGWRPRDAILDFVMPRVDQVLTLTVASKLHVETAYRLKRPAIVVGYSVDEAFFREDAALSSELTPSSDYILAVGNDHTRDYDLLLQACAPLDIRLIIRTDLSIALPQGLGEKVKVIGRRLSYRELRDLYKQARLVALPLRTADNPGGITTLFEAMAMAKPIVCSETGATRDVIVNGQNGLLVPPGDMEAMRATIARLLRHPGESAELGRSARADIEREFSQRTRAERIASAIKDTLCAMK